MSCRLAQILSRLCDANATNQDAFRRNDGIVALVDEIEEYCRGRSAAARVKGGAGGAGGGGDAPGGLSGSATEKVYPLIVGVVDCLWNAVVGNRRSEARMLQAQGVDALLNMLEVCPLVMRHQVTGVIADLCRNERILPYVKAWRSDRTMLSATQLLMRVWEDEEMRLGFQRPDGVIQNLPQPLRKQMTSDARVVGSEPTPGQVAAKAAAKGKKAPVPVSANQKAEASMRKAVDSQDLRSKITAVVACIGFEWASEGLTAAERATLCMACHYDHFREGEAWCDVRDKLRTETIKPIAADQTLLDKRIGAALDTARATQGRQGELADEREGEEAKKEEAYLATILLQRDQEIRQLIIKRNALVPKSLQKRKAEKEAKAKMLAQSLIKPGETDAAAGASGPLQATVGDDPMAG